MTETIYVYVSRILPLLIMPLGLTLLLAVLALIAWFGAGGRRVSAGRGDRVPGWWRLGRGSLVLAVAILWTFSTPAVAAWLLGRLESQFPPPPLQDVPSADCIVVLGGAVGGPLPPRQDIELGEAVDRVYKTAQLYRAAKAGRVLVAAGNQPWAQAGPSEAALIGELLVEWGVPASALQLEGLSRNTRENALNTLPLLQAAGCEQSLLVTSAAHMPRALATFQALGMDVFPVSTDVRATTRSHYGLLDFVPTAHALAGSTDALRESLGKWVYEWRGWN